MHRLMYKIGYEVGACIAVLLSKQSITLWGILTIFYILKGN